MLLQENMKFSAPECMRNFPAFSEVWKHLNDFLSTPDLSLTSLIVEPMHVVLGLQPLITYFEGVGTGEMWLEGNSFYGGSVCGQIFFCLKMVEMRSKGQYKVEH